jgi:hypothetical protein
MYHNGHTQGKTIFIGALKMYFERDSLDWFNMAFKIIISDMHDNKS